MEWTGEGLLPGGWSKRHVVSSTCGVCAFGGLGKKVQSGVGAPEYYSIRYSKGMSDSKRS